MSLLYFEQNSGLICRRAAKPWRAFRALMTLVLCGVLGAPLPPIETPAAAQVEAVGGWVAVKSLLDNLKGQLDSLVNSVSLEMRSRINEALRGVDGLIGRVDKVIKDGVNAAADIQAQLAADVAKSIQQVNETIASSGSMLFTELNKSLANASVVVSQLPFSKKTPTCVFAVTPIRLGSDAVDRRIRVVGVFPAVTPQKPGEVRLSGKTLPLTVESTNTLFFDLPADVPLKEEAFVSFELRLPERSGFLSLGRTEKKFTQRVYVPKRMPFSFLVRLARRNPNAWAEIQAPRAHVERADHSRVTNNGSKSAAELFSLLVGDDVTYDMSQARIVSPGITVAQSGSPCRCCSTGQARSDGWSATSVAWSLYAPDCPGGWCGWDYFCNGGGTWASATIVPTFRVPRRNVPPSVDAPPQAKRVAPKGRWQMPLVAEWTSLKIECTYKDGDTKIESSAFVNEGRTVAAGMLWSAQVQGQELVIQTQ